MAKNKKKGKKQAKPVMSPAKFLAEKASQLPIYKCYVTSDWEEEGECHIIIARERGNGNLCVGNFLVDTWCMGVKDAFGDVNMSHENFEFLLSKAFEMEECDYPTVHNIIYGAVEFAGEADIQPVKDYFKWKGILDEDTDDVPYIDISFGRDGKYYLVARPGTREALMASQLKARLNDRFDFEIAMNPFMDDDYDSEFDDWEEEYSYAYPEYPDTCNVKNQFIADELLKNDNFDSLPEDVIEKILKLPSDEAAKDISAVIMYEIGKTYAGINSGEITEILNSALLHSMILLSEIKSAEGLDALLEIMRQNETFFDLHTGDMGFEFEPDALAQCGKDNLDKIESYLYEQGRYDSCQSLVVDALSRIAVLYPEKREEVINLYRRFMTKICEEKTYSQFLIGGLMASLCDLSAVELIPEIEKVFESCRVDKMFVGNKDQVISEINRQISPSKNIKFKTLKQKYEWMKG